MPEHKQVKIASETLYICTSGTRIGFVQHQNQTRRSQFKIHRTEVFKDIEAKKEGSEEDNNQYLADFGCHQECTRQGTTQL